MEDAKRAGLHGKDNWKNTRPPCSAPGARPNWPAWSTAMRRRGVHRRRAGVGAIAASSRVEVQRVETADQLVSESKLGELMARIQQCPDMAALRAIAKEISALPKETREALRKPYDARKAELSGPKDDGPRTAARHHRRRMRLTPCMSRQMRARPARATSSGMDRTACSHQGATARAQLDSEARRRDSGGRAPGVSAAGARRLRGFRAYEGQDVEALIRDAIAKREQVAA